MNISIQTSRYTPEEAERIKRDVEFYFSTPKGSLPQLRGYGTDFGILSLPLQQLRQRLTVELTTGLRKEFGISPEKISVRADADGNVSAEVVI